MLEFFRKVSKKYIKIFLSIFPQNALIDILRYITPPGLFYPAGGRMVYYPTERRLP